MNVTVDQVTITDATDLIGRKLLEMLPETANLTCTWEDGSVGTPEETYGCKCVEKGGSCAANATAEVTGFARGTETATLMDVASGNYTCYVIANNTAAAPGGVCSEGFDVEVEEAFPV